jgi:hypothetical protein
VHLTKRERSLLGARMTATQRVSVKRIHGLSCTTTTLFRDPADDIDQTGKGKFVGKCNRTACDARGKASSGGTARRAPTTAETAATRSTHGSTVTSGRAFTSIRTALMVCHTLMTTIDSVATKHESRA